MQLDKIQKVLEWGISFGATLSSGLRFEFDEFEGIRCICTEDVDNPEVRIPRDLVIHKGLIKSIFPRLEFEECDSNTWMKFMVAKLKFDSDESTVGWRQKFGPYLECLPAVVDSPLIWNPREVSLLQGTNLGNSLRAKLLIIFKEWHDIVDKNDIFDNTMIAAELALYSVFQSTSYADIYDAVLVDTIKQTPKVWYSFSAFLWSHLIFLSRAFPEYVLNSECDRNSVILLPIIDLLNHNYNSKVEWFSSDGGFGYRRLGAVDKGQQLYNNYGGKGNEELLSGYGFLLNDNLFSSVALKIKLPADQIGNILKEGIKLPTMDDYTTYAFEKKQSDYNPTVEHPELAFRDGVTYLLNKTNESPLNDMLSLFSYLNKSDNERWDELTPLFKGLHSLRLALEHKLQAVNNKPVEIESESHEINSTRKNHATVYRAEQVSILKYALTQLKEREKKWMSENKSRLLTMKKIVKYDPSFIDEELPLFFGNRDVIFPGSRQFLGLWILIKRQNNSFPTKYKWVQESYSDYKAMQTPSAFDEEADLFYTDLIVQNQAPDKITIEEARNVYQFLSLNAFTRTASTDQETILVKRRS